MAKAVLNIVYLRAVSLQRGNAGHRKTIVRDFFDVTQVVHAFRTVFRKRKAPMMRTKLIVLCILPFFVMFAGEGMEPIFG